MKYTQAIQEVTNHLTSIGYELKHKSESGSMYFERFGGAEDTFRVSDHDIKSRTNNMVWRWTNEIIITGTYDSVNAKFCGAYELECAMEEEGVDYDLGDDVMKILKHIK